MFKMVYKKSNIILWCYSMAVFLYAIQQTTIMNASFYNSLVVNGMRLVCMLIPFVLEITSYKLKVTKLEILVIVLMSIIILGNILLNEATLDLAFIIFYLLVCRDIEPKRILISYARAIYLVVLITLLCWKCGVIEDTFIRGNEGLGFLYSTFGPNLFLHACIAFVAGAKEKIKFSRICLMLIVSSWFYYKTNTLSPFIFTWILIILYLVVNCKFTQKVNNKFLKKKWILFIFKYISFIFAGLTILLQLIYNKMALTPLGIYINNTLSNRPLLSYQAFQKYSIKLFGQPILWNTGLNASNNSTEYFYVDSSYLQILFRYGIVMLILLCSMMTIIMKYAIKNKDFNFIISVFVFLAHCIADPQFLSFRYDPFLICIAAVLSPKINNMGDEGANYA